MICPKDSTQCKQYKGIGEGSSDYDFYDTAEIKECPKCKSKYVEYYATFEINDGIINHIKRIGDTIKILINLVKNT